MALTLLQAEELSQNKLTQYVIDEFRKSPLIESLMFDNTVKPQGGNTLAYVYNRITVQPLAEGREINTEYTPQETVTEQQIANLKVLGGSFEIDRVIANDEVQVVNHVEFQIAQKVKATIALFHDMFINGDSSVNPLEFDGVEVTVADGDTDIDNGAIDLSTSDTVEANARGLLYGLRRLIGAMDGATHILANTAGYTAIQAVADFIPNIRYDRDTMGNEVMRYGLAQIVNMGDKPGTVTPVIPTVDGVTSIYAIRLGLDGVHGVSPEGTSLVEYYLPDFTTPGAVKKGEVEAVWATVIKSTKSAGVLRNVRVEVDVTP